MELSKVEMKKENMNEPTHASDATHQTDETKFLEDLIFDSFIIASSDIVELAEVKNLDSCNYNENETSALSGNQDIITSNDTSKGNDQEPAQKTFVLHLKENLVKIFLTLCGPISTYGLYYTDLISDILFMVTLFTNCHTFYYISSLSIIILSYITTVVFLKFKLNIEFKQALCYPFSHSKNLLCHLKNCIIAIWKGDPLPNEPEKSEVFGHHIAFLETMSESMPQLCLQLIILRQFGLSKNVFQALTQTTALYSSVIATCILFAKRRAFIMENQVIGFSSCVLWKSIMFWFLPLLAFFLSAYIIAFSEDSLIFNVLSCGVFLHPIVIIPIGIAIDFLLSLLRNGWKNCKTDKKYAFAYTMPLHFALICFAQLFLTFEWANYHVEHVLNTNFTLKTSFNNYLDFDQCCNRRPCVTKGKPDLDIGVLVTNFVSLISKLIDHANLKTSPHILVLVFTIILMVFYFMTEFCIGNPVPLIEFIIGPSTNEQGIGNGQSKRCNGEEMRPSKTKNLKKSSQMVCCLLVILYIIALLMSPKLFNQTLTSKLFTCEDGLWDSNPNEPLHCIECQCFLNGTIDESNVCEKSDVSNGSCHSQPGCKYGYNGHDCGNCDSELDFFVASYDYDGRPKCQECQCYLKGTGGSNKCDANNGKCNLVPGCNKNFIGEHCEICIDPIPCYKQESSCYPCPNKFLIVGGGNDLATEIIDVQSNSDITSSLGEIPSVRRSAVGGLIGSTPIIFGGWDSDGKPQDSCFTYNQSQWTKTHTMTTKRSSASSVQLNSTTLWIVGGYNWGGYLDSSEFVGLDSTVGKPGPKLPYPLGLSCAVKYSADKVYIIGGRTGLSSLNKVLIFNPTNGFTHIEGPSLIAKRQDHSCALMSNGQQLKIVVAGGQQVNKQKNKLFDLDILSSVEIFDPTTNKWIAGPSLPYKLHNSAMATSPDGGGVILFGGNNWDKRAQEDTLLELRFGADNWAILPQKLKQPKDNHVVIPISYV